MLVTAHEDRKACRRVCSLVA